MTDDTYRAIALDAIADLVSEEYTTESQFKVGPDEDFHESSNELMNRLQRLDDES